MDPDGEFEPLAPLTLREIAADLIALHEVHIEHSISMFGPRVASLIVDGKVYDRLTDNYKDVLGVASAKHIYMSKCEHMVELWLRAQGLDTKALKAELAHEVPA